MKLIRVFWIAAIIAVCACLITRSKLRALDEPIADDESIRDTLDNLKHPPPESSTPIRFQVIGVVEGKPHQVAVSDDYAELYGFWEEYS